MNDEEKGYASPYADEDIIKMKDMYDNVVRALLTIVSHAEIRIPAKRLHGLTPSFIQYIAQDIPQDTISEDSVLFEVNLGEGDTYNVRAVTKIEERTYTGKMTKSDIIHLLNEPKMPEDSDDQGN